MVQRQADWQSAAGCQPAPHGRETQATGQEACRWRLAIWDWADAAERFRWTFVACFCRQIVGPALGRAKRDASSVTIGGGLPFCGRGGCWRQQSQAAGKGGISIVAKATGISRPVIRQGIAD